MSTKCTIFYQECPDKRQDDFDGHIHFYWDMGGHKPAGYYIDFGADVVRVREPRKLLEALERHLKAKKAG